MKKIKKNCFLLPNAAEIIYEVAKMNANGKCDVSTTEHEQNSNDDNNPKKDGKKKMYLSKERSKDQEKKKLNLA